MVVRHGTWGSKGKRIQDVNTGAIKYICNVLFFQEYAFKQNWQYSNTKMDYGCINICSIILFIFENFIILKIIIKIIFDGLWENVR